jgi:hypothetical protein
MAAAGAFMVGGPNRKPMHQADGFINEDFEGMGPRTQQHFLRVRRQLNDYVDEQQALEFGEDLQARPQSKPSRSRHLLNRIFADGNKLPKTQSQTSKSLPLQKQLAHHRVPSPPSSRQQVAPHGLATPLSSRKQVAHHGSSTSLVSRKQLPHHGSSTSLSSRQQGAHHGFGTPQANSRRRKTSSASDAK